MKKLIILLIASSFSSAFGQEVNDTQSLINSMFIRYDDLWYENLTFEQRTTYYQNDTISREEIWYEAIQMPKGLIIKIGSMDSGNGFIFKNDSMFIFRENNLVQKTKRNHDLLILGFSVYFDNPTATLNKLKKSGFDTSYFLEKPKQYIIGEENGKRAWINKKTLLFDKLEFIDGSGNIHLIEFNKYERLGEAWIAPEVVFYKNGKKQMVEVYYDIQIPDHLPDDLLNEKIFSETTW